MLVISFACRGGNFFGQGDVVLLSLPLFGSLSNESHAVHSENEDGSAKPCLRQSGAASRRRRSMILPKQAFMSNESKQMVDFKRSDESKNKLTSVHILKN